MQFQKVMVEKSECRNLASQRAKSVFEQAHDSTSHRFTIYLHGNQLAYRPFTYSNRSLSFKHSNRTAVQIFLCSETKAVNMQIRAIYSNLANERKSIFFSKSQTCKSSFESASLRISYEEKTPISRKFIGLQDWKLYKKSRHVQNQKLIILDYR